MGASESGDRLYFRRGEQQLVAGAPTGPGAKLYLWDNGTLKYVATDPAPPGRDVFDYAAPTQVRSRNVSVDRRGSYMALVSGPSLDLPRGGLDPCPPDNTPECRQVYLYDAEASTPTDPDFTCVSCLPAPQKTPWSAGLLPYDGLRPQWLRAPNDTVSDNGTVVFATATPLLPEDLNGPGRDYTLDDVDHPNVLRTRTSTCIAEGSWSWSVRGRALESSFPIGISPDGRTVAFSTTDRLSGWDIDERFDVYVAREGGGLPEPPPPPFECEGDACLNPVSPPNDPTPASAGFSGAGNPAPARSVASAVREKQEAGPRPLREAEVRAEETQARRANAKTRRAHR